MDYKYITHKWLLYKSSNSKKIFQNNPLKDWAQLLLLIHTTAHEMPVAAFSSDYSWEIKFNPQPCDVLNKVQHVAEQNIYFWLFGNHGALITLQENNFMSRLNFESTTCIWLLMFPASACSKFHSLGQQVQFEGSLSRVKMGLGFLWAGCEKLPEVKNLILLVWQLLLVWAASRQEKIRNPGQSRKTHSRPLYFPECLCIDTQHKKIYSDFTQLWGFKSQD